MSSVPVQLLSVANIATHTTCNTMGNTSKAMACKNRNIFFANGGGYYLLSCWGGPEPTSWMSYRFSPVRVKSGRLGLL